MGGDQLRPADRRAPWVFSIFSRGEFIDVIHWIDDTRDTMVWRFEREGHAIKYGAKLTVREGQAAVFVHEGQLADVFSPGLYMLETNNMPILTTLQHWDHGFQSPFKSEIYFVNTTPLHRPEMGHQEPDHLPRPGIRPGAAARLRHLHDARRRPGEVHDRDRRHRRRVHRRRDRASRSATSSCRNFSQMHRRARASRCSTWRPTPSISASWSPRAIAPKIADYGLELPEFYIENISLPEEVEKVLDKRTSMGVAGDLEPIHRSSPPPRRWARGVAAPGRRWARRLGAGMGMAMGGADGAGRGRGARPRPARRACRRAAAAAGRDASGTSPRRARPRARSAAATSAGWSPRARSAVRRWSGRRAARLAARPATSPNWRSCSRVPPPPPAA